MCKISGDFVSGKEVSYLLNLTVGQQNMDAECRRCGKHRRLCRSHIIPEWAYRPIYDQESRAIVLSSEERRPRKIQQGLLERLFCLDCEVFFNRIEKPFHDFWSHTNRFPAILDQQYVEIDGIDYENTRKFLLSVLWRAHVARNNVLSAVNLGRHADRMCSILSAGPNTTADDDGYHMFGYALRDPNGGGLAKSLVLTPVRKRTKGRWNYQVAFLGCLWVIFVSGQRPPLPESCTLKKEGTIIMPVMDYNEVHAIHHVLNVHFGREPAV